MEMFLIYRGSSPQFIAPSKETAEKIITYNNSVEKGLWFFSEVPYLPHNPVTTAKPFLIDITEPGDPFPTTINKDTFGSSDKMLSRDYFITYRATASGARRAYDNWRKK